MFKDFTEDELKTLKDALKKITNNLLSDMEESR